MKLNKTNYFTKKNQYISNSDVGLYLKCPKRFSDKKKGKVVKSETPALRIGKAVDVYVSEGPASFARQYVASARRSIKNPPKTFTELTLAEYAQVEAMGKKVRSTSAYKALVKGKFKKQQVLQYDMKLGRFKGICGIPDFYKIDDNGHAIIVDLKTSATINPFKYHYHCLTYGYYRQMAMYSYLLAKIFPSTIHSKKLEYKHLVIEKDPDGIYNVATFILDPDLVTKERDSLVRTIHEIKNTKTFKPKNASWEDATVIGGKKEEEGGWDI